MAWPHLIRISHRQPTLVSRLRVVPYIHQHSFRRFSPIDLTYVPKKYHKFMHPAIRKVFLDIEPDTAPPQPMPKPSAVTTEMYQERIIALKQLLDAVHLENRVLKVEAGDLRAEKAARADASALNGIGAPRPIHAPAARPQAMAPRRSQAALFGAGREAPPQFFIPGGRPSAPPASMLYGDMRQPSFAAHGASLPTTHAAGRSAAPPQSQFSADPLRAMMMGQMGGGGAYQHLPNANFAARAPAPAPALEGWPAGHGMPPGLSWDAFVENTRGVKRPRVE